MLSQLFPRLAGQGVCSLLHTPLAVLPKACALRCYHNCAHRALCTTGLNIKGCHLQSTLEIRTFCHDVLAGQWRRGTIAHPSPAISEGPESPITSHPWRQHDKGKRNTNFFFFFFEPMLTLKGKKVQNTNKGNGRFI